MHGKAMTKDEVALMSKHHDTMVYRGMEVKFHTF
jgi:hypothetical protein